MSNKRNIKKQIRTLCGAMAGELLAAGCCVDGIDEVAVAKTIGRIARLQVKALSMCNFAFDKTPRDFADRKAYNKARNAYNHQAFHRLHDALNSEVASILGEMNALVKA